MAYVRSVCFLKKPTAVRLEKVAVRPVVPLGLFGGVAASVAAAGSATSPQRRSFSVAMSDAAQKDTGRSHRPWQEWEDDNLTAGMEKHGTSWALILSEFEFNNRTAVDLKDRARNRAKILERQQNQHPR